MANDKIKEYPWHPFFLGDEWRDCFLMPPNALKVWLYHYSRENEQRESWPKLKTIAKDCRMHRDTVIDARAWLKDNRWLVKVREIERDDDGFQVPVFRVERGTIPYPKNSSVEEKTLLDRNPPATPADNPPATPSGKTSERSSNTLKQQHSEVATTHHSRHLQAGVQAEGRADKTSAGKDVFDPKNPSAYFSGELDTNSLSDAFERFSGHWRFKKPNSRHREFCNQTFESLLARGETTDKILTLMEWASNHPHFSTGLKTISKEFPWDWFARRYDEMVASAEADKEFMVKLEKKIEERMASVARAKSRVTQNADKPTYRRQKGEDITRNTKEIKI